MRTLKVIIASLAIGSLLALSACKKDDKKKEDDTTATDKEGEDTTGAAKTTDDTATDTTATDDTAAGGDMSMDEKKATAEQVVKMFEEVAAAVQANKDDCPKMAAAVEKIAQANKELIAKGKTMDEDAEFKKWFDETHGEKMKATMTGAMTAMMEKCGQDEGVKKAFSTLTGE